MYEVTWFGHVSQPGYTKYENIIFVGNSYEVTRREIKKRMGGER
jgi:hypothetical protein